MFCCFTMLMSVSNARPVQRFCLKLCFQLLFFSFTSQFSISFAISIAFLSTASLDCDLLFAWFLFDFKPIWYFDCWSQVGAAFVLSSLSCLLMKLESTEGSVTIRISSLCSEEGQFIILPLSKSSLRSTGRLFKYWSLGSLVIMQSTSYSSNKLIYRSVTSGMTLAMQSVVTLRSLIGLSERLRLSRFASRNEVRAPADTPGGNKFLILLELRSSIFRFVSAVKY